MALSFPSTPTLNQTYTVGTKTWKWNGSAWDIVAATGTSADSTARASAAAADGLATAAYSYANTLPTITYVNDAVANVVNSAPSTLDTLKELADALGSDVNFSTTVATSIGNVNNKANAAYQQANTAFDSANASITLLQGVNVYQNTTISAISEYSVAAYGLANATNNLAGAAFLAANNGTGASFAYEQANAANTLASAAYNAANNGTGASFAYAQANAAFDAANNVYNISTSGYAQANIATTLAQAAFTKANTGGSNSGEVDVSTDKFTGDGTTSTFILSTTPSSNNQVFVNIDGVDQLKSAFTISTNEITFTGIPVDGAAIEVYTFSSSVHAYTQANNAYIQATAAIEIANNAATTGKSIAMAMVFGF